MRNREFGPTPAEEERFAAYDRMVDDRSITYHTQDLAVRGKDQAIMEIALYLRKRYQETKDDKYKLPFKNIAIHWQVADEHHRKFPYTLED